MSGFLRDDFGMVIRNMRRARRWSQATLAEHMARAGHPMHQSTVAKLEAGKRPTTLDEAHTLAWLFGCTFSGLLSNCDKSRVTL